MSLVERLRQDLTDAMRRRDDVATGALRMTLSAVRTLETSGTETRTLGDEEVEQLIAKEAKRREEAAEAFRAGDRADRASRELAERDVLAAYLPARLTSAEVEAIVDEVIAHGGFAGMASMGAAMKAVMSRVGGRADGKLVSELVRARLS